MRWGSRPLTILLLVAFLAALPSSQALAFPGMPAHMGGCHNHTPESPSPAPPSYQCCAIGHHWAILGVVFSIDRPVPHLHWVSTEDPSSLSFAFTAEPGMFVFPSASPPQLPPLRI